jgi:hypothetical protein
MAISIAWATKVITVPQADLTFISGTLYELDTEAFRLQLKALEAGEEGIVELDTHRHNTEVTVAGVTYARTIEIINGYTITFEDGQYAVRLVGSNNNLFDEGVINRNQVSVIPTNSAGLIRNVDAVDDFVEALRTSIYDGVTFENLMRDVLAMANARIVESPDGVFTFYDRDNTTVRYTLTKAGNERTRS